MTALEAARAAQDVTGQNMANVATPGYHVQRANLVAGPPLNVSPLAGEVGTGVDVASITSVRDTFLEQQRRTLLSSQNYWQTIQQGLQQIAGILNDPSSSGLQAVLNQFWNAWQTLANDPADPAARQDVVTRGQELVTTLVADLNTLGQMQATLDTQVVQSVSQINALTAQIAQLNRSILVAEGAGQQPNDLLDQRNRALADLSKLVSIHVVYAADNTVSVYIDSLPVVEGMQAYSLATAANSSGLHQVVYAPTGQMLSPTGGTLGAALVLRDGGPGSPGMSAAQAIAALESFAASLQQAVNAQHEQGYDLNGNPGEAFFATTGSSGSPTVSSGNPAVLPVNPDLTGQNPLVANPLALVAAASSPGSTADGGNAQAIANLENTQHLDGQYQAIIGSLGVAEQLADQQVTQAQTLVTTVNNQIQAVSGVSLDQQAALMVQYQQMYQASAQMLSVQSLMIQSLLNAV